jgi:hypothetical protein
MYASFSFNALKALSAMPSLGKRISLVQFQVRAPMTQSSQRSSRFHKPAQPRAALGIATIFASMQQPADRFCKAILPEHHRLEDPFSSLA